MSNKYSEPLTVEPLRELLRYGCKHDGPWSELPEDIPLEDEAERVVLCFNACVGMSDDELKELKIGEIKELLGKSTVCIKTMTNIISEQNKKIKAFKAEIERLKEVKLK